MEVLNAANDVLEILRIFTKQISDSRFNRFSNISWQTEI